MEMLLQASTCIIYRETDDALVIELYAPDAIRALESFEYPSGMRATVSVCCDPALEFVRTLSEHVEVTHLQFAVPVSLGELVECGQVVASVERLCIAEQTLTANDGAALSRFRHLTHLELWDVTCEGGAETLAHILRQLSLDVLETEGMNASGGDIAAVCRERNVRVAVVDGDELLSDER